MPEVTPSEWDEFLGQHPDAHILQTREWGELKAHSGWYPVYFIFRALPGDRFAAAQILFKRLPFGLSVAYIGKGPIFDTDLDLSPSFWRTFLSELDPICHRERAVFLKIEPDAWESTFMLDSDVYARENKAPTGFGISPISIQPKQTLIVELQGSEAEILARMKQKTRYNIRLSERKGVKVIYSDDLETFYRLLTRTSIRDAFGVHQFDYYRQAYQSFSRSGQCALLIAEFNGTPLAGMMVFTRGARAWYFYGASSDAHRELMSPYLLQWEAICWARRLNCRTYDLWGIPDSPIDHLEAEFTWREEGLWGVYRFKRGFGGEIRRSLGPWDRVYQPMIYRLYHLWSKLRTSNRYGN